MSGIVNRSLLVGIAFVLSTHAITNPVDTASSGASFSDNGRTVVRVVYGSSHRTAAPPQIDVADIISIGITTLLSSFTDLNGLCVRGPHVVTSLNRTE